VKAAQWENQKREQEVEMLNKQNEILEVVKAKIAAMTDGKEAAEAYRKLFNLTASESDYDVNLDINNNP